MKIVSVEFAGAAVELGQCPPPNQAEFAFIGRSNVGKSSLINLLVGRKALAKVSGTPGKTRTINHFHINNKWYLVDLPGYGFAKVAQSEKSTFNQAVMEYLLGRINLLQTFLLIDVRHKPQSLDLEFAEWMHTQGLPFSLVFTKIDKLSKALVEKNQTQILDALAESGIQSTPYYPTSAEKGFGKGLVLNAIDQHLRMA